MKVLAIDPGYERLGIAVLEKVKGGKETLLYSDCFFTSKTLTHSERIALVGVEVGRIIQKFRPDALAIETLFFSKNQKTAMQVAEARGVILYECSRNSLAIHEFMPNQIKIAVTGYGKSDKRQVIGMVEKLICINKKIEYDDEYDAIATGLTFFAIVR